MPGWFADSKYLMINSWPGFNRRWGKPQSRKSPVSCTQVVNHEVKWGVTHSDLAFQHQDQMRPAAQFVNRDLWTLKYWAHANCPHEVSRFLHTVSLQDDVRHA